MDRSRRAVVIPAYNEEKTIAQVVSSLLNFATVIVVNDFSKDNTAELAANAGAVVVNHTTNKGYETAIDSGFKKAAEMKCDYVITFDADGQHESTLVDRFFECFEKDTADIVIGIRPQPARISEKILALYTQLFFNISDPLCGMKAYKMKYYIENGRFDRIQSIGIDLALSSIKKGARLNEIPVPIHPRQDAPRFGSILKANYKILKSLFRIMSFYQIQNRV